MPVPTLPRGFVARRRMGAGRVFIGAPDNQQDTAHFKTIAETD
jgi:hypothetical protein